MRILFLWEQNKKDDFGLIKSLDLNVLRNLQCNRLTSTTLSHDLITLHHLITLQVLSRNIMFFIIYVYVYGINGSLHTDFQLYFFRLI